MTKKGRADIVQSSMRLPRALHRRINKLAAAKNLSMQQAVEEAIVDYCNRNATVVDLTPLLKAERRRNKKEKAEREKGRWNLLTKKGKKQ